MAEGTGNNEGNGGSSWWGGWMATAKEKTEKAFEMMSHDIAEFTSTMQSDTKKVVEKTKETIQQSNEGGQSTMTDKMTNSFHHLMEGITKALTVEPEDTALAKAPQPTTGIFDRAKARLRAIQVDTGTYLLEPSGSPELYADWLKSFNLDAHKGDVSELLVTMVEVRSLYTTLVPSQVSHQDFWRRYFYKLHQLNRDEARKQALMQRAERADVKEDSINWDEEEWSGDEESGSPEASRVRVKPSNNTDSQTASSDQSEKVTSPESGKDAIESRLNPVVQEAKQDESRDEQDTAKEDKSVVEDSIKSSSSSEEDIKTKVKHKDEETKSVDTNLEINTKADSNNKPEEEIKVETETVSTLISSSVLFSGDHSEKASECDSNKGEDIKAEASAGKDIKAEATVGKDSKAEATVGKDSKAEASAGKDGKSEATAGKDSKAEATVGKDSKAEASVGKDSKAEAREGNCDKADEVIKTKVKGDIVVVGETDRVSPSSDSSGTKGESSTDDWEKDFEVDITAEDLAAAAELAQKMNTSAKDHTTLAGTEQEDDWENWE